MPMISFAQNREDVLLARLFLPGTAGTYIDVGASDPVNGSITKHFYDRGWTGINIEPSTHTFDRLQAERRRDINLNIGLSDREGRLPFFAFAPQVSGISTFSNEHANYHSSVGHAFTQQEVDVTTLARVCEDHVKDRPIDFMSIDVEGHEAQVIAGADWERWRPRVLVIEATEPGTPVPTHMNWEPALMEARYVFGAFDGLNRYYVREEDSDLLPALATPVNVFDDYVPYELAVCQGRNAAERTVASSLRAQYGAIPLELHTMKAEYQRLTASLQDLTNRAAEIEGAVARATDLLSTVRSELAPLADLQSALNGLGPRSLQIARFVRQSAERAPRVAAAARAGLRLLRRITRRRGG